MAGWIELPIDRATFSRCHYLADDAVIGMRAAFAMVSAHSTTPRRLTDEVMARSPSDA
jgi:hypothetical protein